MSIGGSCGGMAGLITAFRVAGTGGFMIVGHGDRISGR
jgi:hypothetical protein